MSVQETGGDGEAARVFIVAASDVVRAGLAALIEPDARFTIAGGAPAFDPALFEGAEGPPTDVVVVDAEGLSDESLAALRTFADEAGETGDAPAFVLIGSGESGWVSDALGAGVVRALLPRGVSGDVIVAALSAVSSGLVAFDPETFAALLSTPPRASDEPAVSQSSDGRRPPDETELDALTPREREVLDMLAEGLSNKEIAWRMKISEHTVKFHVASVFAKLGVSTRTEAVTQGIRRGLVML